MVHKFKTLSGGTITRNINKYSVDWLGACRGKSKFGKFQQSVKTFLMDYWESNYVFEEVPCFGTSSKGSNRNLKLDLLNLTTEVAVEIQGQQHLAISDFFHGGDRHKWLASLERDERKEQWCLANDFQLVCIYPDEVLSLELFKEKGVIL